MIVMKFGGTSVGTGGSIRRVREIVRARLEQRPVVVVSAHAGVTDSLLRVAERAPAGDPDVSETVDRHREILAELELPTGLLDPLLAELADLARGIKLVGEATPRSVDLLLSFGERCAARTVAACFVAGGVPATAVDAWEAGLRTDSHFGRARPLPDRGAIRRHLEAVEGVPVITGFVAQDEEGNITTLGRNGSDYSAALFGEAIDAREIQVWKDVDGVRTADPRLVPDARPIRTMSFDEASEIAYYGGRVLHPATILPAVAKSIPVRVLNTACPEAEGTVILPDYEEAGAIVRAVVHKRDVTLVTLVSPRMLAQHGFLAKVFAGAAEHRVDIDLVATSEVSITMSVEASPELDGFVDELRAIGTVDVLDDQAMVCVVGRGISSARGVAADVLVTLADEGIRVRSISQGAIKVNIALIVARADVQRAVQCLHARFFGRDGVAAQ